MNGRRKRKQQPAPSTPADSASSQRGLWFAAIVSTLALLAAYVWFSPPPVPPPADSPASDTTTATAGERGPTSAESPPVAIAGPEVKPLELPTQPIAFETESEQQALLSAVEEAVEQFPQDPTALHIAALTYGELLQTERALELFEGSLAIDPSQADVVVAYADMLLQVGKQSEAAAALQRTLEQGNPTADVLAALGETYSQLGELDSAVDVLQRGVEQFPDDPELHLRLAKAQVQLEQFTEAEQHARRAIELGQADRAAWLALSTALLRLGKREEALKIRSEMPGIEPQVQPDDQRYQESFRKFASHNYAQLALANITHDRLDLAEQQLARALALDPASVKGLATLGDMLHRQGRLVDALQVYQRLIQVQPENPVNYHNCASLGISLGDVAVAEQALRGATDVDRSGYADLYLARFLLGVGNYQEATSFAKAAVDRSGDIEAYVTWITALQASGKTAFALNALLKAREIAPNDPRLANFNL